MSYEARAILNTIRLLLLSNDRIDHRILIQLANIIESGDHLNCARAILDKVNTAA